MGKKGGKPKRDSSLGKSIQKDHKRRIDAKHAPLVGTRGEHHVHTADDAQEQGVLKSHLESDAVADFLADAELANRRFEGVKERAVILDKQAYNRKAYLIESDSERRERLEREEALRAMWNDMPIPRRPAWSEGMVKEDIENNENRAFLLWRQSLAEVEEVREVLVTPFEKNLQVWRQLWRVVEKADVLCQIVDARNPLLYRSIDLEKYVSEMPGKRNLLVVNKADLLTVKQRRTWREFFVSQGIPFIFWSALNDGLKHSHEASESFHDPNSSESVNSEGSAEVASDDEDGDDESDEVGDEAGFEVGDEVGDNGDSGSADEPAASSGLKDLSCEDVWSREDFIAYFTRESAALPAGEPLKLGMVGYPNVGKSSTINALLNEKKTVVSATPGKTKHFQSLFLSDALMLIDCPGLVFPSYIAHKSEMYLNALLSIDTMRGTQYLAAVQHVCLLFPRALLESFYHISLPQPKAEFGEDPNRPPTASELLQAYSQRRGFTTGRGLPDEHKAARIVLKEFSQGSLLFAYPPPKGFMNNTAEGETDIARTWLQWYEDDDMREVERRKVLEEREERRHTAETRNPEAWKKGKTEKEEDAYDLAFQASVQGVVKVAGQRKRSNRKADKHEKRRMERLEE